ncbi:MAG: SPW repeat protein [Acidibacillus sp.]|nr:SPW repeat protein [Acidibacillus sp.]
MKGFLWAGIGGVVEFVIGLWLMASPWITGFHHAYNSQSAIHVTLYTGLCIAVLGIVTAIGFVVAAFQVQAQKIRSLSALDIPGKSVASTENDARSHQTLRVHDEQRETLYKKQQDQLSLDTHAKQMQTSNTKRVNLQESVTGYSQTELLQLAQNLLQELQTHEDKRAH